MPPSLTDWISWHLPPKSVLVLSLLRMDIWVESILVVVTALQRQGGEPNTPKTKQSLFLYPIPIKPEPYMMSKPHLQHHEGILKACLR